MKTATEEGTMSYGIMLQRLKKEEAREDRKVVRPVAPVAPAPAGQTPTDIVLAALYEPVRRGRRRAA